MEKKKFQFKFNRNSLKLPRNKVFTLVKKELDNYFATPVAYIVLGLFAVVLGILLFAIGKYTQYGSADLNQMFSYIAFSFVIIIPALTMGSISKEKQSGTIEYILTQPISEFEYLISKFISYSILVFIMLILTLPITLLIGAFSGLDAGQAVMQYFGGFLLGICLVSIGIAISALFKSEIASFLTSLVLSALLIVIGSGLISFLPGPLNSLLDKFGLLSHYQSISRGVLDLRDLLYFAAFLILFLSFAYFLLIKDKFPATHKYLRYSQIATIIILIVALLIGYIGQLIPGRIDFTSNRRYTLSDVTYKIIDNAKDVVNITLYASSNLPLEFQSELRNVQDILNDYVSASGGKIQLTIKQPDKDDNALKDAQSAGLTEIKFNVNTNSSAQVVVGYFGMTFQHLDKTDFINISNSTVGDLEYQITAKIKKLTDANPKKIAFLANNVDHTRSNDLTTLSSALSELFDVTDITLTKDSPDVPSDVSAVIIDGPNAKFDDAVVSSLKKFFDNGGSILLLDEEATITGNTATAKTTDNLVSFFQDYGVGINSNLVYDLKQNNIVATQSNFTPLVFNYPLWVITNSTNQNVSILKDVSNMPFLWASSLTLTQPKADGIKVYPLFQTTANANVQSSTALNITFEQNWAAKDTDKVQTLAAAIENAKGGRAVVVGDSDFITDPILSALSQRQEQDKLSLGFTLNSISWLAKDDAIGSIQSKDRVAPLVNFQDWQASTLIISGIGLPLLVIAVVGGIRFFYRRRMMQKKFTAE